MSRVITRLLLGTPLTVAFLASNALPFQDGTRIRFPRGRSSATVRGTVAQGGPDFYVVGARAKQTMVVSVDGKVTFGLDSPRAQLTEDDGNTSWRGELDFDGDYKIRVYSTGGVQKYSLTVSIR